jgi:hypothetical protein
MKLIREIDLQNTSACWAMVDASTAYTLEAPD